MIFTTTIFQTLLLARERGRFASLVFSALESIVISTSSPFPTSFHPPSTASPTQTRSKQICSVMAPQFCSVCGNILDLSVAQTVQCDRCSEINPSKTALNNFFFFCKLYANPSFSYRHDFLRDSNNDINQLPFSPPGSQV